MKRWLVIFLSIAGLCLSGGAETTTLTRVKVLKNNTNLRAKALVTSEVVGQASANDILTAKTMNKDWVEVVPPTNVDLWVLGDYVKDGAINCSQKVNVRAGAGINFNIVGQLSQGEKVEVRGTHAEWVKIAPLPTCSLWISGPLVSEVSAAYGEPDKVEPAKVDPATSGMRGKATAEANIEHPTSNTEHRTKEMYSANNDHPKDIDNITPTEAGKPWSPMAPPKAGKPVSAATPAPAPAPAPVVAVVPPAKPESEVKPPIKAIEPVIPAPEQATLPPPSPAQEGVFSTPPGLDLVPNTVQGRWRVVEGLLRPKDFFFRAPSDFRLVTVEGGDRNSVTICFVKGNQAQLDALIYRHLVVSGREYWVKHQKYPVLVPERIVMK